MCEIDVILNDAETRKMAELKTEEGKMEKHFLFYDGESVSGKVRHFCSVPFVVYQTHSNRETSINISHRMHLSNALEIKSMYFLFKHLKKGEILLPSVYSLTYFLNRKVFTA